MNSTQLRALLTQPEGASLDFKRQFYKLSATTDEAKKREKDELIKDILSLANGNANVAGEESHLIIGAADTIGPDGERDLHGVGSLTIKPSDILQMVNAANVEGAMRILQTKRIGERRVRLVVQPNEVYAVVIEVLGPIGL